MEKEIEEKISNIITSEEKSVKQFYSGDVADRISYLINHYKNATAKEIGSRKDLMESVLVYFRSVVMISESIGLAGTHAEKAARLRGLIELLNGAILKLKKGEEEHLLNNFSWYSWDYSDYPYRSIIEKMSELKRENDFLKNKLPEEEKNKLPDLPF